MAETPSELQAEIEQLERKHAENPDGRYFVPLANDYRKLGELDRAESLLRAGIEKHPDYLSARIVLGRCLSDRGESAGAVKEFEHVLSMDPQNLIALRSLAELALSAGRKGEAHRWYNELLAVDPMNADARQALEAIGPLEPPASGDGSWWDPEAAPEAIPAGEPAPRESSTGAADEGADLDLAQSISGEAPGLEESLDLAPSDFPGGAGAEVPEEPAQAPTGSGEPAVAGPAGLHDELDDWDLPDEVESVEVVTETIAELYARQGLTERAAEVYRELIRRRGGAPELEQRLRELEEATAAERVHELRPEATPGIRAAEDGEVAEIAEISELGEIADVDAPAEDRPAGSAADTATLEAAESWELPEEPSRPDAPFFEPTDLSVSEAAEEPESTFEAIESWEPTDVVAAEAASSDDSDRDDPFASSFAFGFPEESPSSSAASGEAAEPVGDSERRAEPSEEALSIELEPDEPMRGASAELGATPASAGAGGTIGQYLAALAAWGPGTRAPQPRIEERSAVEPEPLDQPPAGEAPTADELGAWESLELEQGLPAAEPPAAPEPEPATPAGARAEIAEPEIELGDYFSDEGADNAPEAEPAAPAPAEPEPEAAEEDDEDLESFQAWLRSLKR